MYWGDGSREREGGCRVRRCGEGVGRVRVVWMVLNVVKGVCMVFVLFFVLFWI